MDDLDLARRCADSMWSGDKASQALGIEIEIPEAGTAIAKMRVREDMVNGYAVCHGGLVFALADTAFAFACNAYGHKAVAASAQIEFLRPAAFGDELAATASEDYRGRRNGYYAATVHNQNGEVVALFRGRSVTTSAISLDDKTDT